MIPINILLFSYGWCLAQSLLESLIRVQRDSQRLKQQPGSLYGSAPGPLYTCCGCLTLDFCWSPNNSSGDVSDSFAWLWNLHPPPGLPQEILIKGFMPSIIVILLYHVQLISLGGLGGEKDWKEGGRVDWSWDVLLGRKINKRCISLYT